MDQAGVDLNTLDVIVAFVGVIVGIVAARIQVRYARRQEETARRQEVGVAEWMRDLRVWASEAIDVLSEAIYASDGMQEPGPIDARRYISQLAALADRGRFFLPNPYTEEVYGTQKLGAFRGFRHAALDPLVAAMRVLEGAVQDKELHDYVVQNRRAVLRELQMEFISYIQQILAPTDHNKKIVDILRDSEGEVEQQINTLLGQNVAPGATDAPGATLLLGIVVERLRDQ